MQYSSLYITSLINILKQTHIKLQFNNTFSFGNKRAVNKMIVDLNELVNVYGTHTQELFDSIFSNEKITKYMSKASRNNIDILVETLRKNKMSPIAVKLFICRS